MVRSLLLKIHLWLALTCGLILAVAGLTGAVLAFGTELDQALNPSLWRAPKEHRQTPLSLGAAAVMAVRDRPDQRVSSIRLPRREDEAYELLTEDGTLVYIDPYKGAVLGSRRREASFVGRVHTLHTRLFAGEVGRAISGAAAALMPVLIGTGLYLFWPKKGRWRQALGVRRAPPRALYRDLHTVAGVASALVLLVLAVTGALLAFSGVTYPLIHRLAGSSPPPPPPSVLVTEGNPVSPDAALKIADQAVPGAVSRQVVLPADKNTPFAVVKQYPEDRTPNGRTRVWIAARGGAVMRIDDTRAAAPGTRVINQLRPWHTGDVLGGVGRVLAALASLLVPGLFVTGLVLWWGRRKGAAADDEAP